MNKTQFQIVLAIILAVIIFLLGRSCGYRSGYADAPVRIDSVDRWVDKKGNEHAVAPVQTATTEAKAFTKTERKELKEVTKGGKVSSVTEVGTTHMIPCREYVTKFLTRVDSQVLVLIDSIPELVPMDDTLKIVHYWKYRQLFADVSSANGEVTFIKAKAVHKEPLLRVGPSVSGVYYDGKIRVLPGISVMPNLRALLAPRKVK